MDVVENKNKRVELQMQVDDLQEKIHALESKLKSSSQELEKAKREGQINLD